MRRFTSLFSLPPTKVTAGLQKLRGAGIAPELWLQMLDADPASMQQLVAMWPGASAFATKSTDIVYDVAAMSRILGIPCKCSDPVPQATDDELIVYYGGWDLKTLRLSPGGKKRMQQGKDWYEKHEWKAEPGYYRILLPVPRSDHRTRTDQHKQLAYIDSDWKPTPVCIAATGLLVHLVETGNDLLGNDRCRCAESLPYDHSVVLHARNGRVDVVSDWGVFKADGDLWFSAAQLVRS